MSANSSDSESSCGWTIINHEGSDIETLSSENGETSPDLASEENTASAQELQQCDEPEEQPDICSQDAVSSVETIQPTSEETQAAPEEEEEKQPDDGASGEAVSDDSDIVTLEPPKVEEVGALEEEVTLEQEIEDLTGVNMGSSFSSQYTFSQLERVEESSNDETSEESGPAQWRRRSKRSTMSGSESENKPPTEQSAAPEQRKTLIRLGTSLNKCVILALVIAISMGFGHFYAKWVEQPKGVYCHGRTNGKENYSTIQIQERQKRVEMFHENQLNDMKDDLYQCQMEQEATVDQLETDHLATCLTTTDVEKKNLALENQHLRESLEREEQALSSLQEELRKLREQIRNLEEKGRGEMMLSENQKLKAHLKEERQRVRNFLSQKETLLTEAQILRKELDKERHITESLKQELEDLSSMRSSSDTTQDTVKGNQEREQLRERLAELDKKLNFEQQRSDLWERLYIEAKEKTEKLETGTLHESHERERNKDGKANGKTKKKARETFFGSVKDTFDAMKNSTKEFVRHHKEKIKQAKEAVKENLKKFSDSVKTTFRHFKDSTKNMFDKNRNRKYADRRHEETTKAKTVRREYQSQTDQHFEDINTWKQSCGKKSHTDQYSNIKGCSDVFECAHQESISLFNKVLNPVTVDEFNEVMRTYFQEQVDNFQHWEELEQFINRFFRNGVFIHDQMLFTDFVNDVEAYLEGMKAYQANSGGVFEDLDEFVYRHFFGNAYSASYGPRKPEKNPPSHKDAESQIHQKQEQKPLQQRSKREGKWQKHGRANGRHMANVEIELGQLPFEPKY
ncbi:cell cycle progression protein 1 isoform X2 [Ascaphus truei]|uniref:cell cycle progression protein 1 isoform X2 n=1 Tax=Ascaphus truei TaxID=8439 RepID=UPI003F5A67E6